MYEKIVEAYQAGNKMLAVARGSSWVDKESNPFPANTREHELFYTAQRNYKIWEKKAINMNRARQLMENAILELAEMGTKNHVFGVLPEEPVEVIEEPSVELPDVVQDASHVFGVIPDKGIVEAVVEPSEGQTEGHRKKKKFFQG